MRVDCVGRGIDANDLLLCFAVGVEFPIISGNGVFELSACIDRCNDQVRLGIDDRKVPRLAIDDEDMTTGGVESDPISVVLCFDPLEGLEGLEIERKRDAGLAVI